MRIGFHLPSNFAFSPTNGIRQEALLKAKGLRELGHSVTLINQWEPEQIQGLDIIHAFYGGLSLSGLEATRSIKSSKLFFSTTIDSNEPHWKYRMAASIGSVSPRLFTVQGEFRRQCVNANRVIVRSNHELERVHRSLGIPLNKISIVLLGVELPNFDISNSNKRSGIFHLSTYGQPRKNIYRLIDAVGPTGIPTVIAGQCDAAERAAVIRHSRGFSNITILERLSEDEKKFYYQTSDIFLLPSTHEGTGLSALEAAQYGCKIVITRNGGPPDYFRDIAWFVDPCSVSDIRNKVKSAASEQISISKQLDKLAQFNYLGAAKNLVNVYECD